MKLIAINDTQRKPVLFTPWTLIHFLSGVVSVLVLMACGVTNQTHIFWIALLIHTIYELHDCLYTYLDVPVTYWRDNSYLNSAGDTVANIVGIWITLIFAEPIRKRGTFSIFLIVSIITLISRPVVNIFE